MVKALLKASLVATLVFALAWVRLPRLALELGSILRIFVGYGFLITIFAMLHELADAPPANPRLLNLRRPEPARNPKAARDLQLSNGLFGQIDPMLGSGGHRGTGVYETSFVAGPAHRLPDAGRGELWHHARRLGRRHRSAIGQDAGIHLQQFLLGPRFATEHQPTVAHLNIDLEQQLQQLHLTDPAIERAIRIRSESP
jgi:hypothetical protein